MLSYKLDDKSDLCRFQNSKLHTHPSHDIFKPNTVNKSGPPFDL